MPAKVPPGSVGLGGLFPTSSLSARCRGIKTMLSPLPSIDRKQLQKATQQGLFLVVVFSFMRESCFHAPLKFLPCSEVGKRASCFLYFSLWYFSIAHFKFILWAGKRLFGTLWKLKDAFLAFKFKTASGTKMMCQPWKRVVLRAVTTSLFNYSF